MQFQNALHPINCSNIHATVTLRSFKLHLGLMQPNMEENKTKKYFSTIGCAISDKSYRFFGNLTSACWLSDNCLTTALQLLDDCIILRWPLNYSKELYSERLQQEKMTKVAGSSGCAADPQPKKYLLHSEGFRTLKVSKFQKQIFLSSFEPKTKQNNFLISAVRI